LFGEACKLSSYLTGQNKHYLATVEFGRSTDSHDREGRTTEEVELEENWLDDSRLAYVLELEWRRQTQVPPSVSAISLDGQRAHAAARAGKPLELEPRSVAVEHLVVRERTERTLTLELGVSKGYYVRALARDIGKSLGVPAHLAALRRTTSGKFSLAEAIPWPRGEPAPLVGLRAAAGLALPILPLTSEGAKKARLGQTLSPEHLLTQATDQVSCWVSPDDEVVAIGQRTPEGLRVLRGFSLQAVATNPQR
jgi:tRNA pseudouridine55 synthase